MNRFTIIEMPLLGLKRIERQNLLDSRGFLSRIFCAEELAAAGWQHPVAQINQTFTSLSGTVRGMHYQTAPHAEMKLVTCLSGAVWDVAVDVRAGSPTFLQWQSAILSADNCHALLIPEGFAHGFQTLTDDVTLLYCHSWPHVPEAQAALHAADPRLAIPWPQAITAMSHRDAHHPLIASTFEGVTL
jgi:dTDP-4-dehydrorhamnose 3,5-epimerase